MVIISEGGLIDRLTTSSQPDNKVRRGKGRCDSAWKETALLGRAADVSFLLSSKRQVVDVSTGSMYE